MAHAMIAPSTPVSVPNRLGNRNTPDPIIEPTTLAVRVGKLTFWSWAFGGAHVMSPDSGAGSARSILNPVKP